MAGHRTGKQRTRVQRTTNGERRESVRDDESQSTSAMDVDANPAAANGTTQLEHVLTLLEAEANAETSDAEAAGSVGRFKLICQALCPLLRSHISKQPQVQFDKFQAKSAVIDERRSRMLVLKNVPESNKQMAVAKANDDLAEWSRAPTAFLLGFPMTHAIAFFVL